MKKVEGLFKNLLLRGSDKIYEDLRCNSPLYSVVPQPETIAGPEYL